MNVTLYDIAIVGGGLAGLCLAIQCAGEGRKVVLFEKEQYPFHKVCGEYISMESFNFLEKLGVHLPAATTPFISELLVTDVKGKPYRFPLPLGGFGISRYKLDNVLYHIASQKGVTVVTAKVQDVIFDNDQFSISSTAGKYTGKLAAGCFGKKSNLDVRWKRSEPKKNAAGNYIAVKYHVHYPHLRHQIALHNFRDGYCGLSAIEDDKSCLCYLTTAAQLQKAGSIEKLQEQVMFQNPELEKIFTTATFLYDEPLAIAQISFAPKPPVSNHVLMVGDAAGLITPLCGNGMSMAMHGSKICFQLVSSYLNGYLDRQKLEEQYAREWRQAFAGRLATGRLVQQFFGHPLLTHFFLQSMKWFPPASRAVIRSTHGQPF